MRSFNEYKVFFPIFNANGSVALNTQPLFEYTGIYASKKYFSKNIFIMEFF